MNPRATERFVSRCGRVVRWAFTGRSGGVSAGPYASLNLAGHVGDDAAAVQTNRDRVASLVDLQPGRVAVVDAVHGAKVAQVVRPGEFVGVDGLVTTLPGIGLLALAADCVPLALMDAEHGIIAAVHCGWRGIGAGIVTAAVQCMRELGAVDIRAVIGPHVCVTCYPVSADRIAQLRAEVDGTVAMACCVQRADQWHIDVGAGVQAQLTALGVEHREVVGCTFEDPDLFSYRRDRVTGRQGVLITSEEPC